MHQPTEPWAEWYWQQYGYWPDDRPLTGFDRWKLASSAVHVIKDQWRQREEARTALGDIPAHGVLVITQPVDFHYAACLGCLWRHDKDFDTYTAAHEASLAHVRLTA